MKWVSSETPPDKLLLALYVDSDFAGDTKDMKFTSGVFLALVGPRTFFPLNGLSTKQTAQSHSTPEAEIIAADDGLRKEGYPAVDLWSVILGRDPALVLHEDNESAQKNIQSGK